MEEIQAATKTWKAASKSLKKVEEEPIPAPGLPPNSGTKPIPNSSSEKVNNLLLALPSVTNLPTPSSTNPLQRSPSPQPSFSDIPSGPDFGSSDLHFPSVPDFTPSFDHHPTPCGKICRPMFYFSSNWNLDLRVCSYNQGSGYLGPYLLEYYVGDFECQCRTS